MRTVRYSRENGHSQQDQQDIRIVGRISKTTFKVEDVLRVYDYQIYKILIKCFLVILILFLSRSLKSEFTSLKLDKGIFKI